MLSDDTNSDPNTRAQGGIRTLSVFLAMLVFVAVALGIFINMIVELQGQTVEEEGELKITE